VLLDGLGNRYSRKSAKANSNGGFTWLCTCRGVKGLVSCCASVKQLGDVFTEGPSPHSHAPDPSLNLKVPLTKQVKDAALEKKYESAKTLAEDALVPVALDNPNSELPDPNNLARAGNRARAKVRPLHPTDLFFEIQHDALPKDFFVGDIRVGNKRHLMFATREQLKDLQRMRRWYVDGTFHVAKRPFSQLFSIHGFVTKNGISKQIPLLYVLMSGREQADYVAVLQYLKSLFDPNVEPALEEVVMDFETAVKRAFEDVFPQAKAFGCAFHWTKCVYGMLKTLGLSIAYRSDEKVKEIVRELLSLPFIPFQEIRACFNVLKARADKLKSHMEELNEKRLEENLEPLSVTDLTPFFDYVEKQWINNRIWPPETWSVFFQDIRTNNDVEGWHYRLNLSAPKKGDLNFYLLVELLFKEANMNIVNKKLIHQGKEVRSHNKVYERTNDKIQAIWKKYQHTKEYTIADVLKYCSKTYRMPCEYEGAQA
jgi:hypothetical protein